MAGLQERLQGGFFVSSMMGVTDGAFCARVVQSGGGCAMVQTGAYLAEPTATAEEIGPHGSSFLPADPGACLDFLAEDCRRVRDAADVAICMNLATPRLEWGLEAAQCFARAGGDLVELNVHGGYGRYLRQGKLRAMVRPEHQDELLRWVAALGRLAPPPHRQVPRRDRARGPRLRAAQDGPSAPVGRALQRPRRCHQASGRRPGARPPAPDPRHVPGEL